MASVFNKLIIENFGPIKKANIEVKDMMIFIGPQASGKSTLAKLITILEDVNFKEKTSISFSEELEKYNISSFLKENTYIEYRTPSFKFTFEANKEDKFDIYDIINRIEDTEIDINYVAQAIGIMLMGISLDEKENILFREIQKHEHYGLNSEIENLFDIFDSAVFITEKLLKIYNKDLKNEVEYIHLLDVVKKVFSLIRPLDSLYIPAERTLLPLLVSNIGGLINNDILIPKNILIAVQQFEKAIQKVTDIDLSIIGSLRFKQSEGRSFIYHNKNEKILLKDSSSGIQSFIPILLLIENSLKTENYINLNYVVEEPELNLYPEAQYKLVKYLVKSCLETTREIKTKNLIITTHSPYVLASINNLLHAHNKSKINNFKTNEIIEECSWIDPNHFNAYEVKKGTVRRIFNKKSKLIEDNIIDEVSEIIMQDFKSLALIQ